MAKLRRTSHTYGPREPLEGAPGYVVRTKTSSYGAIHAAYKGSAKAGHVQIAKSQARTAPDYCTPQWNALPALPPPRLAGQVRPARPYRKVHTVWKAHVKPEHRRKGVGKALYMHAMRHSAARSHDPVVFMPTFCSVGSGTSTDAQRVWRSLKRTANAVPGVNVIMPSAWMK